MEYGLLRLRTSSLHRTADLLAFVRVLDDTYERLSALDDAIALIIREREPPRSIRLYSGSLNYDYVPRNLPDSLHFVSGHRQQISRFVDGAVSERRNAYDDFELLEQEGRLVVRSFRMNSPGFWEFIGSLNPLEVLRNYLNDRHKRRQDRGYGESADAERLRLQNEKARLENERARLENLDIADQIAFRRIDALQRVGVTKKEVREITRQLVRKNFEHLNDVAERMSIDATEQIEPVRRSEPRFPW